MWKHLLPFFVLTVFLSGCREDSDTNPKPGKAPDISPEICRLIRAERVNGGYTTYDYDLNDRIKSLRQYPTGSSPNSGKNTYYIFERNAQNRVSKIAGGIESTPAIQNVDEFEYDSNGRWIKTTSSSIPASTSLTVTVPEYNSQGLIEKISQTYQNGSTIQTRIRTYEYTGGNLKSLRDIHGQKITTSNFEYYLDRPRNNSEIDSLNSYYLGLGSLSKNMVKGMVTLDGTSLMETTYSYIFMEPDYVQMLTMKTVLDGVTIENYEAVNTFNCK